MATRDSAPRHDSMPEVVPSWSRPAPAPADASVVARRLIEIANKVPAGTWVSYGDLADAYTAVHERNMIGRGVASALSSLRAYSAVAEQPVLERQQAVDRWQLPWHRIRVADGRVVSLRLGERASDDFTNQMLIAEGGTVRHGAATSACRCNLLTVYDPTPQRRPPDQ